jgi:hypothetical protein
MEDLIISMLQGLFEFALEVFSYAPFDWPFSSRSQPESETIVRRCFGWFVGGCFLSWLLMLVVKHTFISHPRCSAFFPVEGVPPRSLNLDFG